MFRKLNGESLATVVRRDVQQVEWRKLRFCSAQKSLESVVHRNVQEIEWRTPRFYSAQKCSGN